jgi:hypothetical protein
LNQDFKEMKNYFLTFLAVGFLTSLAALETFAQNSVINKYIAKQAAEAGASENKEGRVVIYGDVNHDGKKDAVVHYTLEGFGGGNSWGQTLAVFVKKGNTYKFVGEETIGGKFFTRTAELKSVTNNQIILTTYTCPDLPQGVCRYPMKGKSIFVIRHSKLKEL